MGNPAGVKRDFGELERRRMAAAKLLGQGLSQAEVARRLSVHRQSVIRWARQLDKSGPSGLKKTARAGRKPKLGSADLDKIAAVLKRGPQAAGYDMGTWTAPRVAKLIEQLCGVSYHPAHVWRILAKLGWSLSRPVAQAGNQ